MHTHACIYSLALQGKLNFRDEVRAYLNVTAQERLQGSPRAPQKSESSGWVPGAGDIPMCVCGGRGGLRGH